MKISDIDTRNRIAEFLRSAPRFKVVVLNAESFEPSFPHVNVGHAVASYLKEKGLTPKAFNEAKYFLSNYVAEAIQDDDEYGKFVCLTNLGIMFEQQLDLSPVDFIANISRNVLVLLQWNGAIDNQKLYFLDKNSKYSIDLENINHITI